MGNNMSINESDLKTRIIHLLENIKRENISKKILQSEIELLEIDGKSVIFPNQQEAANTIWKRFENRKKLMILALGMTQSGKTGVMCACVKKFTESEENFVPVNNIFIITGLSSCEWTKQTKDRMPKSLHDRIIHRDNLNDLGKKIGNKKERFNPLSPVTFYLFALLY